MSQFHLDQCLRHSRNLKDLLEIVQQLVAEYGEEARWEIDVDPSGSMYERIHCREKPKSANLSDTSWHDYTT